MLHAFLICYTFASFVPQQPVAAQQQVGNIVQPLPSQQQSAFPMPQQQPLNCEQILDSAFCKGPALGRPGYMCSWQENECEAVDPKEAQESEKKTEQKQEASDMHEDLCEAFSLNQLACANHPGCVFVGFECKPVAGAMVPGAPFGGHGMFPFPQPGLPLTPGAPHPMPLNPGAPQPLPLTPGAPAAPRPTGPQSCRSLPEPQCFGPSTRPGELCMWDAEDGECVESSESDMEAICGQFYKDPVKCDQHENCFWDEVDKECAENKYSDSTSGKSFDKPVLTQICSNFRDVMSCASQAMCYWDTIANNNLGLCVNVIQAENVCRILDTAIHCSTNALCHWQEGRCQAASMHGILRKSSPILKKTTHKHNSSGIQENLFVGTCASVLGLAIGIFASWAHSKYQLSQVSNEDYRDIMMDMSSERRQVV